MREDLGGETYTFGEFRLDAAGRRLTRRGRTVPLPPKDFDILLMLVRGRGELVAKQELFAQVWPGQFVEENNLTVRVSALRKALGERRAGHRFIETVPGRGYRFVAHVSDGSEGADAADARGRESGAAAGAWADSVAVLPLVNATGDADLEFLADGVTESVINSLSRTPSLKVIARGTVFRYKGAGGDARQAGRALKVRTVLTGRLSQVEGRLVVAVELTSVADGAHVWGDRFSRDRGDILLLQDELARAISEALEPRLAGRGVRGRRAARQTRDVRAYYHYLEGRFWLNRFTEEGAQRAVEYFERAVAADPDYALAHVGLADAHYRLSNLWSPPVEVLPRAKAAALRALELDPELAEAHSSFGIVTVFYEHDWRRAGRHLRRSVFLDPASPMSHYRHGGYLTMQGRFAEALDEFRAAQELDPLSLQINLALSMPYYFSGRFAEAHEQLRLVLEMEPSFHIGHATLAYVYTLGGNYEEALEEVERASPLDSPELLKLRGSVAALMGRRDEALRCVEELHELARRRYVSPYNLAVIHARLGDGDRAIEHLRRAYDDRSELMCWLKVNPEVDALRDDPRFRDLMRRVRLSS